MKSKLIVLLVVALLTTSLSFAQRVRYSGSHHTVSHGGHYSGSRGGSSHKGGHYRNTRTHNHYGRHKR
jgi:hypothetical protein